MYCLSFGILNPKSWNEILDTKLRKCKLYLITWEYFMSEIAAANADTTVDHGVIESNGF